ncbi:hypothetical protein EDC94DRAFT_376648 [Helicostylum pulchrum]|nr:hypothetical protein EDC94DRAFT_376648 [Helicostylum pulchrum]
MSALEMNVETTQKVDAISVPEQVAGTSFKDETKPTIRTLALIKPDAMQANNKEAIIKQIKQHDFIIVQEREIHLSKENACLFYREHEGKPFYNDLTNWMSSAPVYALMLEKEDAIQSWRVLMGPTDSNKARQVEPTSIRAIFGTDGSHNATHGSDCLTSAEREIDLIFNQVKVTHDLAQEVLTDKICKPDVAVEVEVEATQIVNPDPTLLQTGDHVAHDISLVKNDTQDTNHSTPEQQASVQQVCPTKPEPEQQQQTPVQDFEHVLQICPAKPEAEQQLAGDFEQIGSAKRDTDKHQLTREILLVEESTAEPVITQVPSEQQVSGDKNQPTTQETLVVIEASIESSTSENLVAQEVVTDKSITADEKTSAAAAEQEMAKESVAVEEEEKTPAAKDDSVKESYLVKVDLAVEEIPATKEELIDNGDSVIKEEPVIKKEEPVAKEEPVVKNEPVKEESVEDETVKDETEPKEDPIKEEPIVGVTVAVKEEPIVKDELIVEVAVAAKETPVTKDKSIVDAKDEFIVDAKEEPIVDAKEEPIVDAKEEPILEAKEEAIVEKTPVVKEESIVEETSAVKEAPIAEESSTVKEEPVAKENPIVDETPATKEDPVVEETSAVKEAPIAEESSAVKEEPVAKENPIVDETPATKEDSVVEETPVAKVDPVVEETPVVKEEETLAPKEDPVATQGAEGECIVITKEESDKKDHVVENKSDQSTADKEVIESYVAIAETAGAVNKAAVEGTKQAEQKPEQKMPSIADRKKLFTEIKKPEEKKQAKSVNDLIAALGGLKKTPMSSSVNKEKKVEKRIEVVQAPAVIVDVVEEPVPAALKPEPTTTTDNCCPEILDQVIIGVETKQEEQTEPESTKPAMILVNDKLSEAILDHHEEKEEEDNEIRINLVALLLVNILLPMNPTQRLQLFHLKEIMKITAVPAVWMRKSR